MREFWDTHYSATDYVFGVEPNVFLASQSHLLTPGQSALSIADGEGRNGVWLAEQGLTVVSVDVSPVGIEKAKKLAELKGVDVAFEIADITQWEWGRERFDVIAAIFIQFADPVARAMIFRNTVEALKPGGTLILQGYTPKQLEYKTGGPPNVENLYTEPMLREHFADLEITHLSEHEDFIAEGTKHYGMSALIDLVARKPV